MNPENFFSELLLALISWSFATSSAFGAFVPGPLPITQLEQQADVVAVADLVSVDDFQGVERVQLNLLRVMRGKPGTTSLTASLLPPQTQTPAGRQPSSVGIVPAKLVGTTGVWFLKSAIGGWQIIQLANGLEQQINVSIPITPGSETPTGTINQQLLAYLVGWYLTLPDPTSFDEDLRLLISLEADPQDALPMLKVLTGSPNVSQHGMGLAAGIRSGSISALSDVAAEMPTLKSNPKLVAITDSLRNYFNPSGSAAVGPLWVIAASHSGVPGMDSAAAAALQKIGTKEVLPAMAQLLDSSDPDAQLRVSWFFGYFALFADATGNISGTAMEGPFASPSTRQQMPTRNSSETPEQYAQFWKSWWSQNYPKLGFSTP